MGGRLKGWQQERPSKRPSSPGITIMRAASMISALGAVILGRTAEIVLPSISTSAVSKSPIARSSVSMQPPLMRTGRAGAAPEDTARAPAAEAAAIAPAVPVQRNWHRDIADDGSQAIQRQEKLPAEPALRKSVMETSRKVFLDAADVMTLPDVILGINRQSSGHSSAFTGSPSQSRISPGTAMTAQRVSY
jgi:hypothetical protein